VRYGPGRLVDVVPYCPKPENYEALLVGRVVYFPERRRESLGAWVQGNDGGGGGGGRRFPPVRGYYIHALYRIYITRGLHNPVDFIPMGMDGGINEFALAV
jgi:hypothetical protein